jgi:hypothetical protein
MEGLACESGTRLASRERAWVLITHEATRAGFALQIGAVCVQKKSYRCRDRDRDKVSKQADDTSEVSFAEASDGLVWIGGIGLDRIGLMGLDGRKYWLVWWRIEWRIAMRQCQCQCPCPCPCFDRFVNVRCGLCSSGLLQGEGYVVLTNQLG